MSMVDAPGFTPECPISTVLLYEFVAGVDTSRHHPLPLLRLLSTTVH